MKIRRTWLVALVALVATTGCGGAKKPADLPELYPTKITVIQDGAPLEGATVSLLSTDPSMRFVVGFKTDANGVAELRTDGQWKGAPAGKYRVAISKTQTPTATTELPPTDPAARAEYEKKLAEKSSQSFDTVDLKYSVRRTTEELEVVPGGVDKTIDVGARVEISFDKSRPSS